MKHTIIAKNKQILECLIEHAIEINGKQCDLNHIDVSQITDMSYIFAESSFNGDISKWDVSNVESMYGMFADSQFKGDISNWDVSNVKDMGFMFLNTEFNSDLSNWKPYQLTENLKTIFSKCNATIPYWAKIEDNQKRKIMIDNYWIKKELNHELINNDIQKKKTKL